MATDGSPEEQSVVELQLLANKLQMERDVALENVKIAEKEREQLADALQIRKSVASVGEDSDLVAKQHERILVLEKELMVGRITSCSRITKSHRRERKRYSPC